MQQSHAQSIRRASSRRDVGIALEQTWLCAKSLKQSNNFSRQVNLRIMILSNLNPSLPLDNKQILREGLKLFPSTAAPSDNLCKPSFSRGRVLSASFHPFAWFSFVCTSQSERVITVEQSLCAASVELVKHKTVFSSSPSFSTSETPSEMAVLYRSHPTQN